MTEVLAFGPTSAGNFCLTQLASVGLGMHDDAIYLGNREYQHNERL